MTFRQRQRDLRIYRTGTYWWSVTGVTKTRSELHGVRQESEDYVGERDEDNPLYLRRRTNLFPCLRGEQVSGGVVIRRYVNYPIGYIPATKPPEVIYPDPNSADLSNFWNATAARTNPSTPYVDVPTAIAELKDLPDLLRTFAGHGREIHPWPTKIPIKLGQLPALVRSWGQSVLRGIALGTITLKFGLQQMINDVWKLSCLAERLNKRFRYLEKLKSGRTVKRRAILGQYEQFVPGTSVTTLHSEGCTVTGYRDTLYQQISWATMRWMIPPWVSLPFSVMERFDLAQRIESGITTYNALRTFWELVPWSWLCDWFVNISDFIDANNNTIPAYPSGFNYCVTRSSSTSYRIVSKPTWLTLDGEYCERETHKKRFPSSNVLSLPPFPSFTCLTAGQWSILGSLAALRGLPEQVGTARRLIIKVK